MATVTPPANLGFTPSLTVDLTAGVYSTNYNAANYDVARSVTYYVDPALGSDSNNGTSWETAFATLTKAITEANSQTSAEINLRPGTGYTAGWGTTAISKPVTIKGVGGKAIISNGRGGKDFSVTTAPVYRRTGHSVSACYDFSKLDSDGAPQSLTLVADVATVTSTPGSFTIDAGDCYVHLQDGRAPDSDFCTAGSSIAFCQLASGATSVYLKDLITVGSPTRHLTAIQDSTVVEVVCEDCEWHYCKGTTTDSIQIDARGLFIFKNNLLTNGDKDGFNYRPGTTPDGEFWEIDCTVIKCGISGVDACNCSTGHETCYIVRVNGVYKEARHRGIHDIGTGTRSWNINCSAQAGTITDTYVPGAWCAGIPDDGTKMFLEACTASGDEAHFLPLGSAAEIIMRNMSPLPNTGGELPVENIAARVLAAMNLTPPDVNAVAVSAAAAATIAGDVSLSAQTRVVVPVNAVPYNVVRDIDNQIIIRKYAGFSYTLQDVGDLAGVTKITFTVKGNRRLDLDAESLVQVVLTIPADAADGIKYLNKASAASGDVGEGSIAVQTYTENDISKKRIVVSISDKATSKIPVLDNAVFDIKQFVSGDSDILDEGTVKIIEATTWTVSS